MKRWIMKIDYIYEPDIHFGYLAFFAATLAPRVFPLHLLLY